MFCHQFEYVLLPIIYKGAHTFCQLTRMAPSGVDHKTVRPLTLEGFQDDQPFVGGSFDAVQGRVDFLQDGADFLCLEESALHLLETMKNCKIVPSLRSVSYAALLLLRGTLVDCSLSGRYRTNDSEAQLSVSCLDLCRITPSRDRTELTKISIQPEEKI